MSFLSNILNEFTHQGVSGGNSPSYRQQGGYGYGYGSGAPPQVPPPWVARWDEREQRWLYINEQTGERTLENPYVGQGGYRYGDGDGGHGGYSGGYASGYGGGQHGGYYYEEVRREERRDGGGHGLAYGAIGAAAGLAGGALLMHEGEKIAASGVQDVEDFPDDAARWAGRKVQDVEDVPQDIEQDYDRAKYGLENRFDNAVQDVEDIPQDIGAGIDDAAGWVGDKVGDVERFDDGIENAYDQGRMEDRNDDGW